MFLFKTSASTFASVIKNQKHAFVNCPKDWAVGEKVLVSKNKKDCYSQEKQISHIMEIDDIRYLSPGESEKYWKGTEGRWNYLVMCRNTEQISEPFDLSDILDDEETLAYRPVVTFKKIEPEHETKILNYLKK